MTHQPKISVAALVTVTAFAAALLQPVAYAQAPAKPASAAMPGMTGSSSMPAGGMDMKAMMKENNEKMAAMSMTGKPDVDFAMMMRIHHQGAISMAEAELRDGKDPQMKRMAKDIIAAQKKEIAKFDSFLAKQGHSMDKPKAK
jgi:uncharacterized protein (DUF305 family)